MKNKDGMETEGVKGETRKGVGKRVLRKRYKGRVSESDRDGGERERRKRRRREAHGEWGTRDGLGRITRE